MNEIIEGAKSLEGLGIIGFLGVALLSAIWVVRFLYKEKEACAADRLENTIAIGELRGDVRALESKAEFQSAALSEAKDEMREMHIKALEIASGKEGNGVAG